MRKIEFYSIHIDDKRNQTKDCIIIDYKKLYSKMFIFEVSLVSDEKIFKLFDIRIDNENLSIEKVSNICFTRCKDYKTSLTSIFLLILDIYLKDVHVKSKTSCQRIIIPSVTKYLFDNLFEKELLKIFEIDGQDFVFKTDFVKTKALNHNHYQKIKKDFQFTDLKSQLFVDNFKKAVLLRETVINENKRFNSINGFKIRTISEISNMIDVFKSIYFDYGYCYFTLNTHNNYLINKMDKFTNIYFNEEKEYYVYRTEIDRFEIYKNFRCIGSIALYPDGVLAYGLNEKYRCKGIMKDALKSVIKYLNVFNNINVFRLAIYDTNIPSQKVAEYNNFKFKEKFDNIMKYELNL